MGGLLSACLPGVSARQRVIGKPLKQEEAVGVVGFLRATKTGLVGCMWPLGHALDPPDLEDWFSYCAWDFLEAFLRRSNARLSKPWLMRLISPSVITVLPHRCIVSWSHSAQGHSVQSWLSGHPASQPSETLGNRCDCAPMQLGDNTRMWWNGTCRSGWGRLFRDTEASGLETAGLIERSQRLAGFSERHLAHHL